MVILIVATIGVVAFFGYCIIQSTEMNEEERKREDEEQIEYLRKMRKKDDRD